ncbi:GDP-D-glucose phosphorylase 1-like isoform X1 [Macrobrachium rosenbergii]|uniref:GDP-D-glucose phosphorylase 1-like isoform X1 n=2 Tax=Macrobrachium rosenbergii TaxID=79674 RepID=UPI0034D3ECE4
MMMIICRDCHDATNWEELVIRYLLQQSTMETNGVSHSSEKGALVYKYSSADFAYTASSCHSNGKKSSFDSILTTKWEEASDAGVFNYKTDDVQTKIVPGKYNIVTQLNSNRLKLRRRPEDFRKILEPCNPERFNFTKIKPQEVLVEMQYCETCIKGLQSEKCEHENCLHGSLIINAAPICFSHSLIVPYLDQLRPQVTEGEGLTLALHTVLLAQTSDFRVGFNSLTAYASVNHLHFHMYYLPHHLYLETAECINLAGPCYVFKDYFAPGFVFQLEDGDIKKLVGCVMTLVKMFLEEEISHNIFITRGAPLIGAASSPDSYSTIRLVIWGRKPSYGIKDVSKFAVALCELAGHVPFYSEEKWPTVTEDELVPAIKDICSDTYEYLLPKVKKLFS